MPESISPVEARLAQLKLLRMRGLKRSATEKKQSSRERFQTELYQLRHDMNGHEVSGTSIVPTRGWDTVPYDLPDLSMYDGQPFLDDTTSHVGGQDLDYRTPPIEVRPLPYSAIKREEMQTKVRGFVLDEDFAKRLEDHPIYWRVARSVEEATRDFAEQTSNAWDFKLSAETDVEIPTWKRFILSVSIPGTDINERVKLWDLLDSVIRDRIRSLAENYPEHSAEIIGFSKSLYLKMDLD
jgi:hypothetical protein